MGRHEKGPGLSEQQVRRVTVQELKLISQIQPTGQLYAHLYTVRGIKKPKIREAARGLALTNHAFSRNNRDSKLDAPG